MRVHVYVEAFLYYFDLVRTHPEVYKNWLNDDIRLVILNKQYKFDRYHKSYLDVSPYEIIGDGYTKEGKSLENKRIIQTSKLGLAYDADDVVWENSSIHFKSLAIYSKANYMLIGWLDCECETSTIRGTLTVQWNENGVLTEEGMPK